MMELYEWQREAIKEIEANPEKNILLTAPTGAGKTLINYAFLGMLTSGLKLKNPPERVIYTVPIKSLANDKFYELSRLGLDVGIVTGDVSINPGAKILLCTQEVYQNLFKGKGFKVVIDEWHYAFQTPQRALAFVDLSPNDRYLFSSATIKVTDELLDYIRKITGREILHFHTDFRPTELKFSSVPVSESDIEDIYTDDKVVLSVAFTRTNLYAVAHTLSEFLPPLAQKKLSEIKQIADRFHLKVDLNDEFIKRGIFVYHGKLNYSEKIFIEELARRNLLRTVVSTDAISLGVNFPIAEVVFYQLEKFDGKNWRILYPSEFLQISGRAGRKGYFDVGIVRAVSQDLDVSKWKNTFKIFESLVDSPLEDPTIDVEVDTASVIEMMEETKALGKEFTTEQYREFEKKFRMLFFENPDAIALNEDFSLKVPFEDPFVEKVNKDLQNILPQLYKLYSFRFPNPVSKEEFKEKILHFVADWISLKRIFSSLSKEEYRINKQMFSIKELNPTAINDELESVIIDNLYSVSEIFHSLRKLKDYKRIPLSSGVAQSLVDNLIESLNEYLRDPEGKGKVYVLTLRLLRKTGLNNFFVDRQKGLTAEGYVARLLKKEDPLLYSLVFANREGKNLAPQNPFNPSP